MLSDDTISLRHLPRRSCKNCDLQFENNDRFKANYSIERTIPHQLCLLLFPFSTRSMNKTLFEQVETTLASGLNELDAYYYKEYHLRPNPAKTQLTAFHLKNRHADRKLNVTWNGTKLDHTNSPVYLGITLDRSLTYRNHCMKMRAKLSSRNNLLSKLHGTNWGACPHTMRTTATALCLSVTEYCCPVWARSTHHKLVDTTLNETCRLITGCIRPTATPDL